MIPLGYLYKHVAERPGWLTAAHGRRLLAQRLHFKAFRRLRRLLKAQRVWLFNSPHEITELATAASISLEGLKLFYYEAYELQFDEDEKPWEAFEPWSATEVVAPVSKTPSSLLPR